MKIYKEYNSNIYVQEGKLEQLRLLQANKAYPLSAFFLKGEVIESITNASFFNVSQGYVLGRNQGDLRQDTHIDEEVYCDFAVTPDGSYKAGQLHSWDVPNSVCGYSPAAILIKDGQDVELISSAYLNKSALSNTTCQSALAITKDKKVIQIIVDGRNMGGSKGMTAYQVRTFVKSHWDNVDLLCINDGGGSAEMIVNGKVVNKPSDGKERKMFNGLALIRIKEEDPEPIAPSQDEIIAGLLERIKATEEELTRTKNQLDSTTAVINSLNETVSILQEKVSRIREIID